MNTLDIIILVLFIPGILRGISKGLLEQAISLIGIVLSVYLAFKFSGAACTWLSQYLNVSPTVLNILGFALVLILVLLAVLFVAKLITAAVEKASLGWINKVLGLVFSLVKGSALQDSLLYGALKDFGYFVFPYLRQLLTKAS